jgi:hypothetical protein
VVNDSIASTNNFSSSTNDSLASTNNFSSSSNNFSSSTNDALNVVNDSIASTNNFSNISDVYANDTNIQENINNQSSTGISSNSVLNISKNDSYSSFNTTEESDNYTIEPLTQLNKQVLSNSNKNYTFFGSPSYYKLDIEDSKTNIGKRDVYTNLVNRIGAERAIKNREKILLIPAFQNEGLIDTPSLVMAGEKTSETILKTQDLSNMLSIVKENVLDDSKNIPINPKNLGDELKKTVQKVNIKKSEDTSAGKVSNAIKINESYQDSDTISQPNKENKITTNNQTKKKFNMDNTMPANMNISNTKGMGARTQVYGTSSSIRKFNFDINRTPRWRTEYM